MAEREQGQGDNAPREAVVLVHGIWMTGLDMRLLARRLRRCGFTPHVFSYASVRRTPAENARRLADFVARIEAPAVHFVAHSLGGLVLLHLFHGCPPTRPGRVVMLGVPARGSEVGRRVARSRCLRFVVGKAVVNGVLGDAPGWHCERELGIIAGDRSMGMGWFMPGALRGPNDGTVRVEETRLAGAKAHRVVHLSHIWLVLSARVARMVCRFLRTGLFDPS